jgi:sugar/nucleoside kinase (ribokinase family)
VGRGDPLRPDPRLRETGVAEHAGLPRPVLSFGPDPDPLWPAFGDERRFDVLGVGQNSLDRVVFVDGPASAPEAGDASNALVLPGGQVATAVLACARLGLRSAYAGAVGDDDAAGRVLEPLREAGVDLSGVRTLAGLRTRAARIAVERRSGERHVWPLRDPRLALPPDAIDAAQVRASRLLHLDAEHPAASLRAARLARAAGGAVMLDLDRSGPGVLELLEVADFSIVSDEFARWLSGVGSAAGGLRELVARGARLGVVTLGPRGALSLAARDAEPVRCDAFSVEVRDTTGAGDVFHAGFAFGLLQGWGRPRVLRAAHAAAALSCRAVGAQGGLPSRGELLAFLAADEAGGR